MPSSQFHQLNEIVQALVLTQPRSVLDVGVGFAKYGVLTREYLDRGWCLPDGANRTCRVDGIEGFAAYITPMHRQVYDQLYIGDALAIVPGLEKHYDLALFIDVIEHFEMAEGMRLLGELTRRATNVLVSTPRAFHTQQAVHGNEMEIHRSHWRPEHFRTFTPHCFIPNEVSTICMIGPDAPNLDASINSWREIVKRQAPWLVSLYRRGKDAWPRRKPRRDSPMAASSRTG
jgi:hypothetical protein